MDPKGGQILDPKLKEAYDRVMGASIPQAAPKPPAPTAPPPVAHPPTPAPPIAHPDAPKPPEHHEAVPPPAGHAAPPPPTGQAPAPQGTQPHANMSFSSAYVAPHAEKKAPVSGGLLMFAGIIFLVVYTLFWMKWFGMAIPFLP